MTQLIASDIAERRIIVYLYYISTVTPIHSRESVMDYNARDIAGAVRQTGSVTSVAADGIGSEIDVIAVDVTEKTRILGEAVRIGSHGVTVIDRNKRAFSYRELHILKCHVCIYVIVGQVSDIHRLFRN